MEESKYHLRGCYVYNTDSQGGCDVSRESEDHHGGWDVYVKSMCATRDAVNVYVKGQCTTRDTVICV